jgi:hypothetical protein
MRIALLALTTIALSVGSVEDAQCSVVINEIHYDPDVRTELVEFVELYNTGTSDVDISGWYFGDGISYTFEQGTVIPEDGYLIVTENPGHVYVKWGLETPGIPSSLIFGPFEGRLSAEGERIELCDADGHTIGEVDYQLGFPWPTVGDPVPEDEPGSGHSIQLINPSVDNDLGGSWRSAYPTPARHNSSVYLENTPPLIRQVKHTPKQPKSDEVVTITAKITDSDGIGNVILLYQIVEPGSYIPVTLPNYPSRNPATVPNPAYEAGWINSFMKDDGLNGDEVAGDDIYTVQMPASLQVHRRLIRYRIFFMDGTSNFVQVPYQDDPQPNFAYFVYDGVPAWRGAINPNGSWPENQIVTYSEEVMRSLPAYHLISRAIDVQNCQYNRSYDNTEYYFSGTLVYDGEVYDNVHYRVRGQYSTFQTGKEKWKFDFNRGHYFQACDDYGNEYSEKWDKMNIGTGTCPWWQYPHPGPWDRGTRGMVMNEVLAFRLYNMAGVPSCYTNYFHLRVVDTSVETHPTNQYEGDFWGLYLTIEHPDGAYLDEHGLPDGNMYRMDGGANRTHQGRTDTADDSDVAGFIITYNSHPSRNWWGQNFNLTNYYSSRAIGIAINDSDRRPESNCVYYHNSETNQWWMLPWDLDLTFEWATHYTNWENIRYSLEYEEYDIAYKNRARELLDLLLNSDQAWQVIEEIASIISTPYDGKTFVEANRAMWEYHPRTRRTGQFYENNEFFDLPGNTKDWANMVEYYKKFLTSIGMSDFLSGSYGIHALILEVADPDIPDKPAIKYIGSEGYPANDLTFQTTDFSDPQGSGSFAAMKWRIAEVEPGSKFAPSVVPEDNSVVLLESESPFWKYFKGDNGEPSSPVDAWRELNFDDSSWQQGRTSIGYGDNDDNTVLNDMQNNYTTIYLRHKFTVSDIDEIGTFKLRVYVDDGCIIWINGTEVVRLHVSQGFKAYNDFTDATHVGDAAWQEVALPAPYDYLVEGENIVAVHVLNSSINSSDLSIDIALTAEPDDGGDLPEVPSAETFTYRNKPGKYEIDALWQSQELPEFSNTITIPASVVEPGRTYRVRCRMKDNTGRWSHWSDPNQFVAGQPLSAYILDYLRITEVMYNPSDADTSKGELDTDNDDFEFIELKNIGDERLDLRYVSFDDGITFDFEDSRVTSLSPSAFVLVVKDRDAFESRYGTGVSGRIAGEYDGRFANEGENVTLVDLWNGVIAQFEYNDGRGWPIAADGAGHSLVPLSSALASEPEGSLKCGGNWRASAYIGGSPGSDDPEPVSNIVINEVMAHTNYSNPQHPQYESNDWIELYNTSQAGKNLSGWYLSDDVDDLKKWAIPSVTINGRGRVSFDEVSDFHNPITEGFGLNKAGEELFLSYLPGSSEDRVVGCISFKGQEEGISLGRYPNGGAYWFKMTPSRDSSNRTPSSHVVIDELMYHPADANLSALGGCEYIELYNPTSSRVTLENAEGAWRLDGGVDYTFPSDTSISSYGRLIVVGFDPYAETSRLDAFMSAYSTGSLTAGEDILGPWSGNLSNAGERVALEKPLRSDQPGDLSLWVIVDEVIYGDYAPWPEAADGEGDSLHRIRASGSYCGNDPENWRSDEPTPGDNP